ncbi:MAG: S8 family peptidase [Granulosicoccus sp.]|nr:S8 family peptidase [Granulosicoccus sp.]
MNTPPIPSVHHPVRRVADETLEHRSRYSRNSASTPVFSSCLKAAATSCLILLPSILSSAEERFARNVYTGAVTSPAIQLSQVADVHGTDQQHSSPVALIVKPRDSIDIVVSELSKLIGHEVETTRSMSDGAWVVATHSTDPYQVSKALAQLHLRDLIEYGQIDAATRVTHNPDDRLFQAQWQHQTFYTTPASMDLINTWDITTGSYDIVVAVIDTGIRYDHADLTDRLLAGYDFVSAINDTPEIMLPVPSAYNFVKSNDGDGRDPDPTDPGDGVDQTLHEQMDALGIDCPVTDSTWHGTSMTSLLAANGNDGFGIAGVDWHARVLPVRAIGRCGGNRSDLLDAIRWAAGVNDPALPPNPTPARIINLSLGIDDVCGDADQRAIDDAVAAGAIIVAAVGNQGRDLDLQAASPSDCNNVIGVTAVNASGQLAGYSNYGMDVDIAAPGGEGSEGDDQPILVATNSGALSPTPDSTHKYTTGTSVASPLVAGVLSLMLSVNPELTNQELEALLYTAARAFPARGTEQDCTTAICGAGLLDAFAATRLAELSRSTPVPSLAAAMLDDSASTGLLSGGAAGCTISDQSAPDPIWVLLLGGLYCLSRKQRRYPSPAVNPALRKSTTISLNKLVA